MARNRSKKAAGKAGIRPGDAVSLRGAVDTVTSWSEEARRSIWTPEFPQKEFDALICFVKKALDKAATNSATSGVPPSQDPNRERKTRAKGERKPGGQPGHPGTTLQMVENPDEVVMHFLDWEGLPPGAGILCLGEPERRQVFDFECRRVVVEHRLETAADILGRRYVAGAPGVKPCPASYGDKTTALLIELAVLQMLPLARESRLVKGLFQLTVSQASIVNMLMRISALLEDVDPLIRRYILDTPVAHFDGTGCSIRGKLHFIHNASAGGYTYFYVSPKRGREAMDAIGILPVYTGVAIHDCWHPYFAYGCDHSLCGAHLVRELKGVVEREGFSWASSLTAFFQRGREAKEASPDGRVSDMEYLKFLRNYRGLLTRAENACKNGVPRRGRKTARQTIWAGSKTKALVKRLRKYETEILRFLIDADVPFTNNRSERDLRMMKVKLKVSGCFRSLKVAKAFCRIRSYLYTCRNHGLEAQDAILTLLKGELPSFLDLNADLPELYTPPAPQQKEAPAEGAA